MVQTLYCQKTQSIERLFMAIYIRTSVSSPRVVALFEYLGLNSTLTDLCFTPFPMHGAKKALPPPAREQPANGLFLQSNKPIAGGPRHGGNRAVAAFSSR